MKIAQKNNLVLLNFTPFLASIHRGNTQTLHHSTNLQNDVMMTSPSITTRNYYHWSGCETSNGKIADINKTVFV